MDLIVSYLVFSVSYLRMTLLRLKEESCRLLNIIIILAAPVRGP